MNIKPLIEAVANCAIFFETASDDVLDPDEAVSQLEELAAALQNSDDELREAFIAYCRSQSKKEKNPERRRALSELPAGLGLVEEE